MPPHMYQGTCLHNMSFHSFDCHSLWGRNVGWGYLRIGCLGEYLGLRGNREWRNLHKEVLNDLHSSPHIIWVIKSRRIRWARHVACMGEKGDVHTGFWWGNLRVEPLGRPRHRWEDNINMDLQEVGKKAWTGFVWLRTGTGGRPL